jgi:hypothetical protein
MSSTDKCLRIMGVLAGAALVSIFLLNVIVDSYGIFSKKDIPRPLLHQQSYLTKAIGIIREKPDTILIGTSIVDHGFRLQGSTAIAYDTGFKTERANLEEKVKPYLPIYNASVRGGGLYEIYAYLQHAYKNNPHLKHVILGVEWGIFTDDRPPTSAVPVVPELGKTYVPAKVYLEKSLSWASTYDSYQTLLAYENITGRIARKVQKISGEIESISIPTLPNFFSKAKVNIDNQTAANQISLVPGTVEVHQDQILKARSNSETTDLFFSMWLLSDLSDKYKEKGQVALVRPDALDYMRRIVAFAKEKHIKLDVYVSPQPAVFWVTANNLNLLPSVDHWLRELSKITPFWDFSGAIDFSKNPDEFFPSDGLHFDEKGGELILPTILHALPHPELGIHYVTNENIESIIGYRHTALNTWLDNNIYLKDVFANPNFAYIKHKKTQDWRTLGWDDILPTPYEPAYKKFKVIKFGGRFIALPADESPYDLRRVVVNSYPVMLTGASLKEVEGKIDTYPSTSTINFASADQKSKT